MTKPIRIFTVLAALFALGTTLPAQTDVRVATIDLSRALDQYWKTQKKTGEFMESNNRAQEQVDDIQKRMAEIADEVKKLQEEANNPAINKDAKDRITGDAQKKFQEYRNMQERLAQFVENTQRALDDERKLFMELMFGEINNVVQSIGKARGANFIVDTSGRTTSGMSSILFADPAFDITDAVVAELNKSKPADFTPPAPPSQ